MRSTTHRTHRLLQRYARVDLSLVLASVSTLVAASPLQEAPPVKDRTLTAEQPERHAHFGYTMAGGRLGTISDTKDDLVVCAMHEDEGSLEDVSAIYVFLDENLEPASPPLTRLLPKEPYDLGSDGIQMGRLEALVGNPRGASQTNLILAGASRRNVTYPGTPSRTVDLAGSVEVFDTNAAGFDGHAQLSLVAPNNPGQPPTSPTEVVEFGHGLALGDINADGVDDVIVGAPHTETGWGGFDDDAFGRIYVFQGHSSFVNAPYVNWVGLNAPQYQAPGSADPDPEATLEHLGSGFGVSLLAVDFDLDEKPEVVVGRHDRIDRDPEEPAVYLSGSAQIFRGDYLHDLVDDNYGIIQNSSKTIVDPPRWPAKINPTLPEYQMLLGPSHIQNPPDPELINDWFGWTMFAIGDMGSLDGGPPDGLPDIAIHAEGTDYIGTCPTCDCDNPQVHSVGGLFVYFGVGPASPLFPTHFVQPGHILMQRPSNVGMPEQDARFGRAAAGIQLLQVVEGAEPEILPALLVSEPNATTSQGADGGHVMLFRAPLCPLAPQAVCLDQLDPCLTLQPVDAPNAWTAPLLQPDEPLQPGLNAPAAVDQLFGSDIVALDYKGDQFAFPGQQFVISSRKAKVILVASDGHTVVDTWPFAGAAFSFDPAGSTP